MFSVIIPFYNKSDYFELCIRSVIKQNIDDIEIIIINDGSTEPEFEALKRIIDKYCFRISDSNTFHLKDTSFYTTNFRNINLNLSEIRVILINQDNYGISQARNFGSHISQFDYLAFIDADDWWEPTYLDNMKKLIGEFPGAGLYGSNYYIVKNSRKKIAEIALDTNFGKGYIDYFKTYSKKLCMPIWTGAAIIPKSVYLSENGFKPDIKLGEDFDLWIRIALKYPVVFLNQPLSNYNQDVIQKDRAVGNLFKPENHVLWNLNYLNEVENSNFHLKQLLDNLRVYSLLPYYLNCKTRNNAKNELSKVNWEFQPIGVYVKYRLPIYLLSVFNQVMILGSKLNKQIRMKFRKLLN